MNMRWIVCLAGLLFGASVDAAASPTSPASAFAALPEMSLVSLSPNGQRVAWANDPGGKPLVVVFDLATGKDLKRLQPSNARISSLDWADDKTLIMSVRRSLTLDASKVAEQRFEFHRFLALDVEATGGEARSLLMEHPAREAVNSAYLERLHPQKPGTVIMSTYNFSEIGYRSEMGSRIVGGSRDAGWELSLFEVDLKSGNGRMIESGTPYTSDWILDSAGRPVARADRNHDTGLYSVFAKQGANWKAVYSAKIDHEFQLVGLSADGASILARSARGSDRFKIWQIPLTGGEPTLLYEHPQFDVTSIAVDRFTAAPVGYAIGGPEPTVVWTDPKMESIRVALTKAFPGKDIWVSDRSADYKRIVARVESSSTPSVYYLIDFAKGSADIIGEAYPSLAEAALGTLELTSYRTPDGYEIPAYLTLPPGREPKGLPLVVFPHGGPYARDEPGFDWWAQFLATRGYAVLQPQFRGSLGFGAELFRAGHKQWGRGMQDDISEGVRYLAAKGTIDPKRVCIVGASYGGYAALAGAAFTPELYACAASINGIADITQMAGFVRERGGDDSDGYREFKDLIGHPNDDDLIKFSPARSISSIRSPVLLVHATNDTVVPPSQSDNFARLLKQHGKPYEYVTLEGEDHWLSTSHGRLRLLEALETFLAKNLQ
jgi:dipeptidyl aminopeptidase/acylaminoacyl peptidase